MSRSLINIVTVERLDRSARALERNACLSDHVMPASGETYLSAHGLEVTEPQTDALVYIEVDDAGRR